DASSGLQRRHRLNRGGDRQLNCALHVIALARIHPPRRNGRLLPTPTRRRQDRTRGTPLRQTRTRPLPLPPPPPTPNTRLDTIEASDPQPVATHGNGFAAHEGGALRALAAA